MTLQVQRNLTGASLLPWPQLLSLGVNRQEGTFSRTSGKNRTGRQPWGQVPVAKDLRDKEPGHTLRSPLSPPQGSRPLSQLEARCSWKPAPSRAACGWKAKRCAAPGKSPLTNVLALMLYLQPSQAVVCNLVPLKAASTWNHFLVCLLARKFSQLFYLFETRSCLFLCLKSNNILTWNPLSVLPIYAEELDLEDLLILRARFSLLEF